MSTVTDILKMINKLSSDEQKMLKSTLLNTSFNGSSDMNEFLSKERFANGRVCPICGSTHVVRNGHRADGTQKYVCRDCKKAFVIATNSIVSGTKKDFSVWEKYILCMMQGLSLRKTAAICGINKNTAFYWRHKILDALQNMADEVTLNGIVEADETFFSVSYKGNHKNSKSFVMPRKAHYRGSQTHTRGLSSEKVCVPCAVNRSGLSLAKVSNLGRVSTKNLHSLFNGRIAENSTLVTDEMNSYIKFADKNSLHLIQFKKGKEKYLSYSEHQ
jgi:transposase-like protein